MRVTFAVCGFVAALLCASAALALPNIVVQEGYIQTDAGQPLEGVYRISLRIYDASERGQILFEEVHPRVSLFSGYYAVAIGSIQPLPDDIFERPELYLGVTINEWPEMTPRTPLMKVPAAFTADFAMEVRGSINPDQLLIGGQVVINAQGEWVGSPVGLRGPAGPPGDEGPAGPQGPRGEVGPAGQAGGDGSPDTAAQIRDKLLTVDGAGSGIDADRLDGLNASDLVLTPDEILGELTNVDGSGSSLDADRLDGLDSTAFMRTDRNTGTTGSLDVQGPARLARLQAGQTSISAQEGTALSVGGSTLLKGSLNLSANPVSRVGKLEFESPVNEGGLRWQNSDARINVAPELQGALLLQSTQTGIVIDGDVRMRGDFRTEDRLAGQSIWTANQQVISPDGRWTGSSVGLDADTLDGLDSTDFLRVDDLDDLNLNNGTLENVAVITPGGDPTSFVWRQTRATDFLNGQLTEIDAQTSPGDLQLVNTGGESRIIAETGTLDIDHEWVTVQLQNQFVDPVIVATSPTLNGSDGVTVRVRNVTPQQFEVRLHEWDCEDGPHTTSHSLGSRLNQVTTDSPMAPKSKAVSAPLMCAATRTHGHRLRFKSALMKHP